MRKVMALVLAAFIVFAAGAVRAEKDSHYQATVELLELFHMEKLLSETLEQMLDVQIQQDPSLKPFEGVMKDFLAKYMSWEALKDDYIRIYMEEFTEAELRDMIEFYKTSTGQKAIEKTPVLAAKGSQLGQQRVQENIDELIEMLEKEAARLEEMEKQDAEE
ncbi:MAG: DUF2059 domain-containing protein [Desulfobacterales bacterium]|nr:DUF2059 domain-containing protein [Desulfobacterales bacterium]